MGSNWLFFLKFSQEIKSVWDIMEFCPLKVHHRAQNGFKICILGPKSDFEGTELPVAATGMGLKSAFL